MSLNFTVSESAQPHVERGREILKKYPEIRKYMKPYPATFFYITLCTALQLGSAYYFAEKSVWLMVLWAYAFGALINHGLFALMHDCVHNLVFKSEWGNILAGFYTNIAQAFPCASSFRTYHIIHHSKMGEYDYNADLASHGEAKWVGNSRIKKCIWLLGFAVVESIRPSRLKKIEFVNKWLFINFAVVIASNALIWYAWGFQAYAYLVLSTIFAIGLHPVGARWIQEHYVFREGQETYSYYGILNIPAFNVGMHNEHHDIFTVPWVHLPKIREMAPEYYNNLYYHTSWTKLLFRFIWDRNLSLYSRVIRDSQANRPTSTVVPTPTEKREETQQAAV